jgi:hypothetical protein
VSRHWALRRKVGKPTRCQKRLGHIKVVKEEGVPNRCCFRDQSLVVCDLPLRTWSPELLLCDGAKVRLTDAINGNLDQVAGLEGFFHRMNAEDSNAYWLGHSVGPTCQGFSCKARFRTSRAAQPRPGDRLVLCHAGAGPRSSMSARALRALSDATPCWAAGYTQFASFNPSTWPKCFSLFVTSVTSRAIACAAISAS